MKKLFTLIILVFLTVAGALAQDAGFRLQEGDLLFQDSDCGVFCDAIKKVTYGIDGLDFSHVGIVVKNDRGELEALEAISEGVKKTPLREFLRRNVDHEGLPLVVVGRLKEAHQALIPQALAQSERYMNKPYDQVFDIHNDMYYCSELVYYLFKTAEGQPLFDLEPMTFNDPETGTVFPAWESYYEELNYAVPEGKPGLNPGSISRSEALDIFFPYSRFDHLR